MRIDLIFPVIPPTLDGIGDHTAHLAAALADQDHDVRILTAQSQAAPIPGVQVLKAFDATPRRGIRALADAVAAEDPDWLVLQYNPFSYGRWGLNLSLPTTLRDIRRRCPDTRIALLVHEPFVPVENWRFALFTTWQRWQLWQLGRAADTVFVSIEPWVERFRHWFPETPIGHLPVGSNIPHEPSARAQVRNHIGVADDTLVCGLFGSAHESRDLTLIQTALRTLQERGRALTALYVGTAGAQIRALLNDIPLIDAGPLPAPDVSRHFSGMDLYLAPFRDGVSTRRGSFMVGLQHGVASITTVGPDTGASLRTVANTAFLTTPCGHADAYTERVLHLATSASTRQHFGQAGQALYETHYDWPHIAARLLSVLAPEASSQLPAYAPGPTV